MRDVFFLNTGILFHISLLVTDILSTQPKPRPQIFNPLKGKFEAIISSCLLLTVYKVLVYWLIVLSGVYVCWKLVVKLPACLWSLPLLGAIATAILLWQVKIHSDNKIEEWSVQPGIKKNSRVGWGGVGYDGRLTWKWKPAVCFHEYDFCLQEAFSQHNKVII